MKSPIAVIEEYKLIMKQYNEAQALIDGHFEGEMRFEAESFEQAKTDLIARMSKDFEAKMERLATFKEKQTKALKEQYAISE